MPKLPVAEIISMTLTHDSAESTRMAEVPNTSRGHSSSETQVATEEAVWNHEGAYACRNHALGGRSNEQAGKEGRAIQ